VSRTAFGPKGGGSRDMHRRLSKASLGVPEEVQRAILHEGAGLIVAEAKRLVPVDTGRLRDSIQVTDDLGARVYGKLNGFGLSVFVGPVGSTEDGDVYYAKFQEFGWLWSKGQPFMRPAIATQRPAAETLVLTRMRAAALETMR